MARTSKIGARYPQGLGSHLDVTTPTGFVYWAVKLERKGMDEGTIIVVIVVAVILVVLYLRSFKK